MLSLYYTYFYSQQFHPAILFQDEIADYTVK